MPPKSSQQIVEDFWTALQNVAKEVLSQGAQYGYGYSLVEIKVKDGVPSVVISSHTESRLYKDDKQALADIGEIITKSSSKGSQSFTIVRNDDGSIKRLLLDEYSMHILKS